VSVDGQLFLIVPYIYHNPDQKFYFLKQYIRNSQESFEMIIDILNGINPNPNLINRCQVNDKIVFITPDFEILNCRTLWGKPQHVPCDAVFDLVCCGFQN
jgi:hypothetical protein